MIKGFLLALQFLTVIPLGSNLKADKNGLAQSMVYFPLIGLVLGLILAGMNVFLAGLSLNPLLTSVVLVTLLIVFTGGLHLDGLADTFDALLSGKERPQMLEIMRDSHIGTMGVLSLICIILLKLSLLYSLPLKVLNLSLILMCTLSRFTLVLVVFLFTYARREGKARTFFIGMNARIFTLAAAITLVCSGLVWGLKGLTIFLMAVVFAILSGRLISKKIGALTGDALGAINELTEVFVLLIVFILRGVRI